MRQTLYRFYDLDDHLLYVGISDDLGRRLDQHARGKTWWRDVAIVRVQHHPDRASVREAERLAIQTEHPLHNVVHAVPRPAPTCVRCAEEQRETLTERERQHVQRLLDTPGHVGGFLAEPTMPHSCAVTAVTEVPVTTAPRSATNSDRSDRRVTRESTLRSLPYQPSDLLFFGGSDHQ
jgi:predicted GIY-YIG superfamily endonuclease